MYVIFSFLTAMQLNRFLDYSPTLIVYYVRVHNVALIYYSNVNKQFAVPFLLTGAIENRCYVLDLLLDHPVSSSPTYTTKPCQNPNSQQPSPNF